MAASVDHVWPVLSLGWRSVLGTLTGFLGAALGSAGGVGGGSIFVPTANIILGFDTKSSTALSKCMIMGQTVATFGYTLRLKHPQQRHLPLIDYDMALLMQPMLLLGISVGVIFNTVFPTWILTIVLIAVMVGTGLRISKKAMQAWRQETSEKEEAQKLLDSSDEQAETSGDNKPLNSTGIPSSVDEMEYSLLETLRRNIKWGNVGVLFAVWGAFSTLQILQSQSESCSARFWILNALQVPIAVLAFSGGAFKIYKKSTRKDADAVLIGEEPGVISVSFGLLVMTAAGSLIAGVIAGLVGLGGGFAIGPLLLEFGAHPKAISATATFTMLFSSSMSVLEYYLVGRFPVPYALYLIAVSIIGGISGQYVMDSLIKLLGRASIIIVLMTCLTFISAVVLGGVGIVDAIYQLQEGDYMGFVSLC
eukprot:c19611_g1_i1 orf=156-1418(-)